MRLERSVYRPSSASAGALYLTYRRKVWEQIEPHITGTPELPGAIGRRAGVNAARAGMALAWASDAHLVRESFGTRGNGTLRSMYSRLNSGVR